MLEPTYLKSELLERVAINSTTFNNWRIRGLIPLSKLGITRMNLKTHKYSPLVAAYCRLLSLHRGNDRKRYVKCLHEIFEDVIESGTVNNDLIIAVNSFGTSGDCGVFESLGSAMQACPQDSAFIPAGKIINQFIESK